MNVVFMQTLTGGTIILIQALAVIIHGEHGLSLIHISYDAVVNAGRLMKEGHANMVKLEGGKEVCPQIEAIVKASIPVCAHLGLCLLYTSSSRAG